MHLHTNTSVPRICTQVVDMSSMFYYAVSFRCDLSPWLVGRVRTFEQMFYNCRSFNVQLDGQRAWGQAKTLGGKLVNAKRMFDYCPGGIRRGKQRFGYRPKLDRRGEVVVKEGKAIVTG